MTKEELINLVDDEAFQEAAHDFVEYMTYAVLGLEETSERVYDSKAKKYRTVTHEVKLMEVLISIKDALWTIAENM